MSRFSQQLCPTCKNLIVIIGSDITNKKIGSCGHVWKFKKTKSSKMLDRKYISTPFGLELRKK